MKPTEIRNSDDKLVIRWSDGSTQEIAYPWLRTHCSCALCREMRAALDFRSPVNFQSSMRLKGMSLLGNYAVEFSWLDGHKSIYAFDRLQSAGASA